MIILIFSLYYSFWFLNCLLFPYLFPPLLPNCFRLSLILPYLFYISMAPDPVQECQCIGFSSLLFWLKIKAPVHYLHLPLPLVSLVMAHSLAYSPRQPTADCQSPSLYIQIRPALPNVNWWPWKQALSYVNEGWLRNSRRKRFKF